MKPIIEKIRSPQALSADVLRDGFEIILSPETSEADIADFLLALTARGLDADILVGAAEVLREHMIPVDLQGLQAIDTCGTGGDRKGSFNFSTAAAILVAACGVPVAKHGNRAITSKSGSADLLEALGIPIQCSPPEIVRNIQRKQFAFMLAPNFHPATARVQQVRKKLDEVTVFNFLGPLLNPAGVKRQVVGVFSNAIRPMLAEAFFRLKVEKVWVVSGEEGLDEISPTGTTRISEVTPQGIEEKSFVPEDAGLRRTDERFLKGGDGPFNAKLLHGIFERTFFGPIEDGILLNAAGGLVVAGHADDMKSAVRLAKEALQSGAALRKLEELKD